MVASNSQRNARNVREQSRRIVRDVKGLGSLAADAAIDQGEDLLDAGRDVVRRYQGDLQKMVSAHPLKSLLVAIGVGTLLGLTLRGR